jgi:hypothetical protein
MDFLNTMKRAIRIHSEMKEDMLINTRGIDFRTPALISSTVSLDFYHRSIQRKRSKIIEVTTAMKI